MSHEMTEWERVQPAPEDKTGIKASDILHTTCF